MAGLGRSCIASGVLILLFVGYQLWGTGVAEARDQERLRSDFLDALDAPLVTTPPAGPEQAPPVPPADALPSPTGEAVAIIRIPRIGVEKAVVEGVSVEALKQGPGHYPTTPLPGQPGNAAVAGHRTTYGAPFFRLDELESGDAIQVTTRQGDFTYRVRESKIVRPDQNEVLDPSSENLLTLTTCNPRYSAAQRLIVVASLVDEPAAPMAEVPEDEPAAGTEPGQSRSLSSEESVSGDTAPKGPAVAWGALAALVWFTTWLLSRRWGRITAYAMGAPVFFVVLFIFFENVARLLPANV